MLTACGIETLFSRIHTLAASIGCNSAYRLRYWNDEQGKRIKTATLWLQQCLPLAVLKLSLSKKLVHIFLIVATVLTACGIETVAGCNIRQPFKKLQQCLPLAVLKLLSQKFTVIDISIKLQQCLPLAVLKLVFHLTIKQKFQSCNSAYRLRYWNQVLGQEALHLPQSCNSAYRLRYWNTGVINHHHFLSWSCNSAYCLRYWN